MIRLADKRIMVTGGAGFLGRWVVMELEKQGCQNIFVPRSAVYDLTKMNDVIRMYDDANPEIVVHLAARMGNIQVSRQKPGELFFQNLIMGLQLMEQARLAGASKFVAISTISAYPESAPVPFREENMWNGYPEEILAPYGLAKKMLLVQSQAYRQQYGFNSIVLLPTSLYGPGDNFDPELSHVAAALIKKCVDAVDREEDEVVVWGTGGAVREFLYAEDAAEAIVLAIQKYDKPEPVNLGSGFEISLKDFVNLIAELTGFKGRVVWDPSQPEGQPRKCLDTSKAEREFGFKAKTSIEEGLKRTIEWYRAIVKGIPL